MDGTALIYCEGALGTARGRTANGLLRYSRRYEILGAVDSRHAGRRTHEIVRGAETDVPVFAGFEEALDSLEERPRYLVVGLNTEDARELPRGFRDVVRSAIGRGINVDSAHRPFLHDDAEFPQLAMRGGRLRSVGYPARHTQLRRYTGRINGVRAKRITVVGTTAPVGGKNATSLLLAQSLGARGLRAEMIGTSVESWFQGVRHTVILDSVVQRHAAGELEHAVVEADEQERPDVLVLEGHGSLLDPENPTGLVLLTTARPDLVILQHAPTHESFAAGDRLGVAALGRHVRAVESVAGCPVAAVALSATERGERLEAAAAALGNLFALPVLDVLSDGAEALADVVLGRLRRAESSTPGRAAAA